MQPSTKCAILDNKLMKVLVNVTGSSTITTMIFQSKGMAMIVVFLFLCMQDTWLANDR